MNKISIKIGGAAMLFIAALFVLLYVLYPAITHGNVSSFIRSIAQGSSSGVSTTSPNYMTAGNSTTTIAFDSAVGNMFALDSTVLQLAIKSSTTVPTLFGTSTLSLRIEQSDNGIDWSLATSSTIQTGVEQMGSNAIASTSVTMRTIVVSTPLRYMRAIVGVNPGSSNNAAAWGQWVGKKQER